MSSAWLAQQVHTRLLQVSPNALPALLVPSPLCKEQQWLERVLHAVLARTRLLRGQQRQKLAAPALQAATCWLPPAILAVQEPTRQLKERLHQLLAPAARPDRTRLPRARASVISVLQGHICPSKVQVCFQHALDVELGPIPLLKV